MKKMQKTSSKIVVGCIIDGSQEAQTEILAE
jgi:hypothetical protein